VTYQAATWQDDNGSAIVVIFVSGGDWRWGTHLVLLVLILVPCSGPTSLLFPFLPPPRLPHCRRHRRRGHGLSGSGGGGSGGGAVVVTVASGGGWWWWWWWVGVSAVGKSERGGKQRG
jgi:hypothetical protein